MEGKKRQPDVRTREAILIAQRGRCLYCMKPLDGSVFRHGKKIALQLNWDHMVPYAYLGSNPGDNWAAACQVCNMIKDANHFISLQECRDWIEIQRYRLGYTDDFEPEPELEMIRPRQQKVKHSWKSKDAKCQKCGKIFKPYNGRKLYCSAECQQAAEPKTTKQRGKLGVRECVICDGEFMQTNGNHKYCSSECAAEGKRQRVEAWQRERGRK